MFACLQVTLSENNYLHNLLYMILNSFFLLRLAYNYYQQKKRQNRTIVASTSDSSDEFYKNKIQQIVKKGYVTQIHASTFLCTEPF